jgi:hypothetical protein
MRTPRRNVYRLLFVIQVMKAVFLLPVLFSALPCFCQKQDKVSGYIDLHIDKTIYDRTLSNNAGGFGAGVRVFINTKTKFTPGIEISSDAFGGTKELYLTSDGRPIYAKDVVSDILLGSGYSVSKQFYFNVSAGPCFFNSSIYLAVKPAIGIFFPGNQLFVAKISLTQVFQRDNISNESFGFLNFGIGVKLF